MKPADILLLALLGGIATGVLTGVASGSKKAGLVAGSSIILLALLILYLHGKEERSRVEKEIDMLPEEDQQFWKPVLDHPETLVSKLQELIAA